MCCDSRNAMSLNAGGFVPNLSTGRASVALLWLAYAVSVGPMTECHAVHNSGTINRSIDYRANHPNILHQAALVKTSYAGFLRRVSCCTWTTTWSSKRTTWRPVVDANAQLSAVQSKHKHTLIIMFSAIWKRGSLSIRSKNSENDGVRWMRVTVTRSSAKGSEIKVARHIAILFVVPVFVFCLVYLSLGHRIFLFY